MNATAEITETYDRCGRLKYHPDYHPNHGKPFTTEELEYMCKYFETDGRRMISMALGRTEHTISTKVTSLKRSGLYDYYKNLNRYW